MSQHRILYVHAEFNCRQWSSLETDPETVSLEEGDELTNNMSRTEPRLLSTLPNPTDGLLLSVSLLDFVSARRRGKGQNNTHHTKRSEIDRVPPARASTRIASSMIAASWVRGSIRTLHLQSSIRRLQTGSKRAVDLTKRSRPDEGHQGRKRIPPYLIFGVGVPAVAITSSLAYISSCQDRVPYTNRQRLLATDHAYEIRLGDQQVGQAARIKNQCCSASLT